MHLELLLLGLATGQVASTSTAVGPNGAYAVLKAAPTPPRPGCQVTTGPGGELRAALMSDATAACPIARVAEEEIGLGELAEALAGAHTSKEGKAGRSDKAKGIDFGPSLDRLVDVRLVVLEARDMGLPELPEYRQALDGFRDATLRTTLQKEASAGAKPDPAEVERLFNAMSKEWKVRSALFDAEADAKAFRAAVAKGGSFDALAKAAVSKQKARGGEPGWVSRKEMVPELAKAADAMKPGQLSEPVKVTGGWVVFKLEEVRHPEDAKAREAARAQSLAEQQHQAVRRYHEALAKKYARIDDKLLASLDFEAGGESGFNALAKDQRVLAEIQGEPPITVAQVADEIAGKYFHGIAEPIKEHRVNPYKRDAFDILLGVRLFGREARERKLDQSPEFRRKVDEYDRVLAFNIFLQRVILPGVKVTEQEVVARYEQRKGAYTTPQMYRLDGLAFKSEAAARAALEKLRGGTDLDWLRANAEGRLPPEAQQVAAGGALLSVHTIPASLTRALSGAKAGELRLYSTDDGTQHYVLRVADQVPPGVQPYLDVREPLAREVEGEKVTAALKEYAGKLRKVQKVDVVITRIVG